VVLGRWVVRAGDCARRRICGSRGAVWGLLARPPRTGLPRCRFAECPGDGLPRPAHPCRREFGVVAELLGDPLGAARAPN